MAGTTQNKSKRVQAERVGALAVDIEDAKLPRGLRRHDDLTGSLHQIRIAKERINHAADELRAFAVGKIQCAILCSFDNGFGAHKTWIKRNDGDIDLAQFVRAIGCQLVRCSFGNAVNRIADISLRCPEAEIDDEPGALFDHARRGEGGSDERCAHAGIHHAVPAMQGLLPERQGPGERAVLIHPLIAAPGIIHQDIEAAGLGPDCGERCFDLSVIPVITGDAPHRLRQINRFDAAPSGKHFVTGTDKGMRNSAPDPSAGTRDERYGHPHFPAICTKVAVSREDLPYCHLGISLSKSHIPLGDLDRTNRPRECPAAYWLAVFKVSAQSCKPARQKKMAEEPAPESELDDPPRLRRIPTLKTSFLTGLAVTAPIGITVFLVWNFVDLIDDWVRPIILEITPRAWHPVMDAYAAIPGLGLLVVVVVLTILGALTANIVGRTIIGWGDVIVHRVPVIGAIYKTLKQIFETVVHQTGPAFKQVCLIEWPRKNCHTIAFVIGPTAGEITPKGAEDLITVFLPHSPSPTSGYLMFLPRDEVKILDMTVEEGIKMVVSVGIVAPDYNPEEKLRTATRGNNFIEKLARKLQASG